MAKKQVWIVSYREQSPLIAGVCSTKRGARELMKATTSDIIYPMEMDVNISNSIGKDPFSTYVDKDGTVSFVFNHGPFESAKRIASFKNGFHSEQPGGSFRFNVWAKDEDEARAITIELFQEMTRGQQ